MEQRQGDHLHPDALFKGACAFPLGIHHRNGCLGRETTFPHGGLGLSSVRTQEAQKASAEENRQMGRRRAFLCGIACGIAHRNQFTVDTVLNDIACKTSGATRMRSTRCLLFVRLYPNEAAPLFDNRMELSHCRSKRRGYLQSAPCLI